MHSFYYRVLLRRGEKKTDDSKGKTHILTTVSIIKFFTLWSVAPNKFEAVSSSDLKDHTLKNLMYMYYSYMHNDNHSTEEKSFCLQS